MTRAQVEAAIGEFGGDSYAASEAIYQMSRKAYCKAAGIPDQCTNRTLTVDEIYRCLWAADALGGWPAVIRMATHLIEEAARSGEATTQ